MRRSAFTLLEIAIALVIFAVGVSLLLDRRNRSFDEHYIAQRNMKAMDIIDEVLADYRLHPFSEEARPLPREYEGFDVSVDVAEESINIIPEDWRIDTTFENLDEAEEKKKRVILRVTVDVSFKGIDEKEEHRVSISTLIRKVEIDEDEDEL